MCGIISIVRRPGARTAPAPDQVTGALHEAVDALAADGPLADACRDAAAHVERADRLLRGADGVYALVHDRSLLTEVEGLTTMLAASVKAIETQLDADGVAAAAADKAAAEDGGTDGGSAAESDAAGARATELERTNAAVVRLKDAVWAVGRDRVPTARAVADLAGPEPGWSTVEIYTSIQQALAAIDRLEVRGRDSAGLNIMVRDHGLDVESPSVAGLLARRTADPLFRSGAVRVVDGCLSFVYKAAAEIGELGDNTHALRAAVRSDDLLRRAVTADDAAAVVLGHTRWASVGIVSEANTHPLDSTEANAPDGPWVAGVLNGDVDNFADLKAGEGLQIAPEITTDAKVIPTLVSRRLAGGHDIETAFRDTAASFDGSVAIAAIAATAPGTVLLALRGSGQALYVGVADDAYVVASEPYGVVEMTDRYLRMDGDAPADGDNPDTSRGQIVMLDGDQAGTLAGIERIAYDGTLLPVKEDDLSDAEITTRDIDRGDFPHYLLKEITEAPDSFRKTLRGKIAERDGRLQVVLGADALPDEVRAALRSGAIERVRVVGQGTAAVAGEAMAHALATATRETPLRVDALPATELSGFELRPSMADTLVVAISQSGTTTDTNRTVELARHRGAKVIAIVNRRGSDLTERADGVIYTSDGRDVEMSVASTKAFYAQIAAGFLLAAALAEEAGGHFDEEVLVALRELPEAMTKVVGRRDTVAEAARSLAPGNRYWAVVGNGVNRIAASEIRIKLSELCYKAIACDRTEDKKHIDLSSEPLIIVCAAGLSGSTADDVSKEVAIYRAHKASPIVIATEGQARFASALHVITVPATHPQVAFVLSAMAGHLFGYEAALAIDAQARPLREARAAIEAVVGSVTTPTGAVPRVLTGRDGGVGVADIATGDGETTPNGEVLLHKLGSQLEPLARNFGDGLRVGNYDGHLEASTAVRLATLFRYALGLVPLEAYQLDEGKVGTPAVVVDDLTAALTQAIEELTRPIDAIKHQAKTVTVGISRSDENLLEVPLVVATLDAGAPRDQLTYRVLRTLAQIGPVVAEVRGFTRYRIESRDGVPATITVIDRGGIARDVPSRADRSPELRGTKHRVANEREVLVGKGRSDGRPIVIVPEVKDGQCVGITLLHVRFADVLPAGRARGVLQGYRNRYAVLRDAVLETEPTFREDVLGEVPVDVLLTEPINQLADRWRA